MAFQFAEEIDRTPNLQSQSRDTPDTRVVNWVNSRDDRTRDRLDSSEIGIDIMKVALPSLESNNLEQDLEDFIESVSDAVSACFAEILHSSNSIALYSSLSARASNTLLVPSFNIIHELCHDFPLVTEEVSCRSPLVVACPLLLNPQLSPN
jgi:hypothetical protein